MNCIYGSEGAYVLYIPHLSCSSNGKEHAGLVMDHDSWCTQFDVVVLVTHHTLHNLQPKHKACNKINTTPFNKYHANMFIFLHSKTSVLLLHPFLQPPLTHFRFVAHYTLLKVCRSQKGVTELRYSTCVTF